MSIVVSKADGLQYHASQIGPRDNELQQQVSDADSVFQVMLSTAKNECLQWRNRWGSANEHLTFRVTAFDNEYMHPTEVTVDDDQVVRELGLKMRNESIQAWGQLDCPSANSLRTLFEAVVSQTKNDSHEAELASAVRTLFPTESYNLLKTIVDAHEFNLVDPLALLKSELAASYPTLCAMEAQLSQTIDERDSCLRNEDISGAHSRTAAGLQLMENIIESVHQRVDRSRLASNETSQFKRNYSDFVSKLQLEGATKHVRELSAAVAFDVQSLQQFISASSEKASASQASFESNTKTFRGKLEANSHAQVQIWEQVMALLEKLHPLIEERSAIIVAHTEETKAEQCRKVSQQKYEEACSRHAGVLDRLRKVVSTAGEFVHLAEESVRTVTANIEKSGFDAKAAEIQKVECLRFYDIFKRYMLFAGEAAIRKEQRLEDVQRMLRSTEFQVRHAMETLDTELPRHKENLGKLHNLESELVKTQEQLKQRINQFESMWQPIEHRLDAEWDVQVDPPSLLLQRLQRDLKRWHVEAIDELTTSEQKLLDEEKANARKLFNAYDAACATVEEKKHTRQTARSISPK